MSTYLTPGIARRGALLLLASLLPACAGAPRVTQDPTQRLPMQGYTYGSPALAKSPVSLADLRLLQGSLLFTGADVQALRLSRPLLEGQVEDILDVWYGFVASTPQLVQYFSDERTGEPDGQYLDAVRERFAQWILDTADARYDQRWLDYQHEIGLRHHSAKKNQTDGAASAPIIHFRYLPALVYPITATLRPFLEKGEHTPEQVDAMHAAWTKSVLLQTILWCHPYVNEGQF